ncbi:ABC transporter permease [Streptomyces sp. LP11]|uniref:ABC transporter permease n=1 Tax=Streptomyces pyxinicus TaxID=2970331 RepID=A0ABT2AY12_9ACTN|nr:ABC transporter permease [Streptomyces sp. LP11]MCS0600603.1 ABC transporter permease [Streptomyces sp. LP11]
MTTASTGNRPRTVRWLLRLHRPALYGWAALVVVLAGVLLAVRGPLTDAAAEGWRQYNACQGEDTACSYDQDAILRYKDWSGYATFAVTALPFLVAGWAGGALTGRELETGTAWLGWTQSTSPARWLAVRLAVPAAVVTAGAAVTVWLHHLAWSAGQGRVDTAKEWYDRFVFHANGPSTVALALAGLAAGALCGLLLRRTLPALLLGVVVTAVVRLAAEFALPHLWPAVTRLAGTDQVANGSGITVDEGYVTRSGAHVPLSHCAWDRPCADVVARFHTYQPRSHYWPLQLTTSALILAVAALLVAACFLVLRRRTGATHTAQAPAVPTGAAV